MSDDPMKLLQYVSCPVALTDRDSVSGSQNYWLDDELDFTDEETMLRSAYRHSFEESMFSPFGKEFSKLNLIAMLNIIVTTGCAATLLLLNWATS